MSSERERFDEKPADVILSTLFSREDAVELVRETEAQIREGFAELQLENPNASLEELMSIYVEENPEVFSRYKSLVERAFDETGSFQLSRSPLRTE